MLSRLPVGSFSHLSNAQYYAAPPQSGSGKIITRTCTYRYMLTKSSRVWHGRRCNQIFNGPYSGPSIRIFIPLAALVSSKAFSASLNLCFAVMSSLTLT